MLNFVMTKSKNVLCTKNIGSANPSFSDTGGRNASAIDLARDKVCAVAPKAVWCKSLNGKAPYQKVSSRAPKDIAFYKGHVMAAWADGSVSKATS